MVESIFPGYPFLLLFSQKALHTISCVNTFSLKNGLFTILPNVGSFASFNLVMSNLNSQLTTISGGATTSGSMAFTI
jgi:hypothetical protein